MLTGWRLAGVLSVAIGLMAVTLAAWHHFDVDGVRLVIRSTARTSLLLFCLAFSAAALYQAWPNAWTQWQRQNRRYLGVSFAFSHAVHAAGIIGFALLDPVEFRRNTTLVTYIAGGVAYAFIAAMTATSFDKTAAWVGPRAWKMLHTVGAYYLWLVFLLVTTKRAAINPAYWAPVVLLLAVMAIRLVVRYRAKYRPGNLNASNAGN